MKLWEKMKTPKFLHTSGSPTRTRKRVPISDINLGHRTADSGYQTSEIGHRTLHIGHQASDIRHRASEIRHRASNIGNQTSDIGHWTSDIRHWTSDIGHRCFVRYLMMSNLRSLLFDVWPMDIGHLKSVFIQFLFLNKKLGLLACYSFGFNFGTRISLGFVGTLKGIYFRPFDRYSRQFSGSKVSPWGVKAIPVQKLRVYSWTP